MKHRPVEEVIDPSDEYEEKLLELIEKAYRGDKVLFRKLAKLYDKAVYTYHMNFKKAYKEALELLEKQ